MAHLKKWYAVNNDSHFHKKLFTIGCESAFTIDANCRSRCMRIVVHDRCEYAATARQSHLLSVSGTSAFTQQCTLYLRFRGVLGRWQRYF